MVVNHNSLSALYVSTIVLKNPSDLSLASRPSLHWKQNHHLLLRPSLHDLPQRLPCIDNGHQSQISTAVFVLTVAFHSITSDSNPIATSFRHPTGFSLQLASAAAEHLARRATHYLRTTLTTEAASSPQALMGVYAAFADASPIFSFFRMHEIRQGSVPGSWSPGRRGSAYHATLVRKGRVVCPHRCLRRSGPEGAFGFPSSSLTETPLGDDNPGPINPQQPAFKIASVQAPKKLPVASLSGSVPMRIDLLFGAEPYQAGGLGVWEGVRWG